MTEIIVELDPEFENKELWSIVIRCETDICKGDRLIEAIPYTVEFTGSGETLEVNTVKDTGFPINLCVEKLFSYGKEWDILHSGMTGKIFVSGDASKIKARSFLLGKGNN